jgi:hypothetical protein
LASSAIESNKLKIKKMRKRVNSHKLLRQRNTTQQNSAKTVPKQCQNKCHHIALQRTQSEHIHSHILRFYVQMQNIVTMQCVQSADKIPKKENDQNSSETAVVERNTPQQS